MSIAAAAAAIAAAEAAARDSNEANTQQESNLNHLSNILLQQGILENLQSEGDDQIVSEVGDGTKKHAQLDHGLMPLNNDENSSELIQHLAAEQQQTLAAAAIAAATAKALKSRPDEHFITMSQNGIILGMTDTITGFPADNMLMTSVFDSIFPDDVYAFNLIKTKYWEKGIPDVEIVFRRRDIDGGWIWIIATVVSFVDTPIPGMIVRECKAKHVERAKYINKVTRLSVVLLKTIEASKRYSIHAEESKAEKNPEVKNNLAALEAILSNETGASADDAVQMKQLVQMAVENDKSDSNEGGILSDLKLSSPQDPAILNDFEIFQPKNSECVGLDISKFNLDYSDVKLITLLLTGHLSDENLGDLVMKALDGGNELDHALKDIQTEKEFHEEIEKNSAQTVNKADKSRSSRRTDNALSIRSTSAFQRRGSLPPTRKSVTLQQNSRSAGNQPIQYPKTRNPLTTPPPITYLNLSFTKIGNQGLEQLCEVLTDGSECLRILDLGFCNIEERGFLSFSRAIRNRKKKQIPDLHGLVLSGNRISYKAAKGLGSAFSQTPESKTAFRKQSRLRERAGNGYDEDDEEYDYDINDDDEPLFGEKSNSSDSTKEKLPQTAKTNQQPTCTNPEDGLSFLHLACTSLTPESLHEILVGLGQFCPIQELSIASNNIGPVGAKLLVSFLEGKGIRKYKKGKPVMARLDRIDLSNNNLGNEGATKLTRAILKRVHVKLNIVKMKLSSNGISPKGIETIMDKLLRHNLMSLSLDNNMISDRGCQLVAASLPLLHHIARLNLSFNQIGSRGITALMRAVVGCESLTSLCVSGNVLKISGAIAMGFALAQHPRLAQLELENCCLSQVSQCHIVAGIISNRWVPMKEIIGFRVGPPMAAIGALDAIAHHLSNEECFRIRRDMQMKNILDWMETARAIRLHQNEGAEEQNHTSNNEFKVTEPTDLPSQDAYIRMLEWLSRIPFDEDELNDLRKYFFDVDGGDSGDGMRGSDGQINLKHRGDLLAALGSKIVEEIRDSEPLIDLTNKEYLNIGLSLDDIECNDNNFSGEVWNGVNRLEILQSSAQIRGLDKESSDETLYETSKKKRRKDEFTQVTVEKPKNERENSKSDFGNSTNFRRPPVKAEGCSMSSLSIKSSNSGVGSITSTESKNHKKARISNFPPFAAKLEVLKSQAQREMDVEQDLGQQDAIAQKFAEDSLTLLRQLRYHCMNNGLDGWRQGNLHRKVGKLRRKVLIVDDSAVTRKLVSRAFEKADFIVDTAANGREGVEKMKLGIYDIAFMDIHMPIMNGFDATKALREWEDENRPGARQPICALTATYVDDFERSELMKFKDAGLDVMESKPCNIPRLFKVVDDVSPMFSDLTINVSQVTLG